MFFQDAQAIVVPANLLGTMGAGVAKAVAMRYKACLAPYRAACKDGRFAVGRTWAYDRGDAARPRWIVFVATKRDWRDLSDIADVEAGLRDLARFLAENEVQTVAVPALGTGYGGLDEADVFPLFTRYLAPIATVAFHYFRPPFGT